MKNLILLSIYLFSISIFSQKEMDFGCVELTNKITYQNNEIYNNGEKSNNLIIKQKNVLTIELTKENKIKLENEYVHLEDITFLVEQFLNNGGGIGINNKPCKYCMGRKDPTSSDHPNKAYILIGNRNDFDQITLTHYNGLYAQIKKAYNNLWVRLYKNLNGTTFRFSDLDCKEQNEFIKEYYPINIIYDDNFRQNNSFQKKPPPAPEKVEIVENQKEVAEGFVKEKVVKKIDNNTEIPFSVVETIPIAFGCESFTDNNERKKCVSEKIKFFIDSKFDHTIKTKLGLTNRQRIHCVFKISSDGVIENVKVRASHQDLENEAIRVINLLPKFIPGKQQGINVIVNYSLPIILN